MRPVYLHAGKAGLPRYAGSKREPLNDVQNLVVRERPGLTETAAGYRELHSGRPNRLGRNQRRSLPAGVTDLHPHLGVAGGTGLRHRRQACQPVAFLRTVDNDVTGPLEVATVDLHVAGQQRTGAAVCPAAIQLDVAIGRPVVRVGETLGHGRRGESIGQNRPARQGERLGDG